MIYGRELRWWFYETVAEDAFEILSGVSLSNVSDLQYRLIEQQKSNAVVVLGRVCLDWHQRSSQLNPKSTSRTIKYRPKIGVELVALYVGLVSLYLTKLDIRHQDRNTIPRLLLSVRLMMGTPRLLQPVLTLPVSSHLNSATIIDLGSIFGLDVRQVIFAISSQGLNIIIEVHGCQVI